MRNLFNKYAGTIALFATLLFLFISLVLFLLFRHRFDPFLTGIREIRLGMSEAEMNRLFPESRFERVVVPKTDGGKGMIIFRYGIDDEHKFPLSRLPEEIQSATAIPYFYGEFVLCLDKNGLVEGFCHDGEGRSEGREFWMRRQ